MDKSNTYNGFSGNICALLKEEFHHSWQFLRFFYISAIEEKEDLMRNLKSYKGRTRVSSKR